MPCHRGKGNVVMAKSYHLVDIELIWKAIYNQASEEELGLLNNWIQEDVSHRKYYEDAKNFFENGSSFDHNPSQLNKAWKSFEAREKQTKHRLRQVLTTVASVAASVLLIVALFYYNNHTKEGLIAENQASLIKPGTEKAILIFDDGKTQFLSGDTQFIIEEGGATIKNQANKLEYISLRKKLEKLKFNTLQVPQGGEYCLVLSDGTKVWLNSESSIRYPVRFSANERKIELSGEAYFEVSKNENQPFLVITGDQQVKVLGTSFNISSYDENPVIFTTLVEGQIEVSLKSNPQVKQLLNPNDQSYYAKGLDVISKRTVDPSQYIAWKDGRFVFQDENLSDIMKTLSKWYDIDVFFTNEKARQIRFTGNLQRNLGFEEILKKIEKTNEIEFKIKGNQIIIE